VYFPRSEEVIVEAVSRLLALAGFEVSTHVRLDGTEIDVVAIERAEPRPLVTIVEVKRRPKVKLLKQLRSRLAIADYLYAAMPYVYYAWALERIDPRVGLLLFFNPERVEVFRKARFLGNGARYLELAAEPPLPSIAPVR